VGKTRAVRISDKDDQAIEEFLRNNPIFDFSTLAKTAIIRFIENPEITLKAVKKEIPQKRKSSDVSII
jgi:hypothetical protein